MATFVLVHGSVRDPDEYIINSVSAQENLAILRSEYPGVPICFFGHTHVKTVSPSPNGAVIEAHTLDLSANGPYLVNPGSVGQPRDGDTFASYVLAQGEHVTYRFVEYDIQRAQDKIRSAGLPQMLADRLAVGRYRPIQEDEVGDSLRHPVRDPGDDDCAVAVADQHHLAQVLILQDTKHILDMGVQVF